MVPGTESVVFHVESFVSVSVALSEQYTLHGLIL